jgi:hypothetical protein
VVVDGAHLPPKYTVALAARRSVGRVLEPSELTGGPQTNSLLEALGFLVEPCSCGGRLREQRPASTSVQPRRHAQPTQIKRHLREPEVKRIRTAEGTTHDIARLVVDGATPGEDLELAERVLLDAFERRWPDGERSKFTITPGGFVLVPWPRGFGTTTGWSTPKRAFDALVSRVSSQLAKVVTPRVCKAGSARSEVLTIGLDVFESDQSQPHAELVAVVDLKSGETLAWTGKSYPTGSQEHTLLHVLDLDTHLVEAAGERVLVLGCHDLNMYSPRGHATQSPTGARRRRCDDMKAKVARFQPTVVLQHPHTTDTPNIWRMPWCALEAQVPSVRSWASGIAYWNRGAERRASLDRVLALTQGGGAAVDVMVRGGR